MVARYQPPALLRPELDVDQVGARQELVFEAGQALRGGGDSGGGGGDGRRVGDVLPAGGGVGGRVGGDGLAGPEEGWEDPRWRGDEIGAPVPALEAFADDLGVEGEVGRAGPAAERVGAGAGEAARGGRGGG